MDINISSQSGVQIGLSQDNPTIKIGGSKSIDFEIASQSINITPKKSNSPAFEFVQKVVAGANVVRCTFDQFNAMSTHDGKTWYAVTTTQDELRYLYLGATLIAKASEDGGTWGFAYTFPITFGR